MNIMHQATSLTILFLITNTFSITCMEIEHCPPDVPKEIIARKLIQLLSSYLPDNKYGVLSRIPFSLASKQTYSCLKDRDRQAEQVALHELHKYACTEFDDFITQPVYLRNFINPCRPGLYCLLLKPCAKCEEKRMMHTVFLVLFLFL